MDSFLFEEWFLTQFVPSVKTHLMRLKLPLKAILVLDNAPTHPINLASDNIKLMFLPPNVTSLVQPMDQGVIASLKKRYKRNFLAEVLEKTTSDHVITEAVKKINIKDVIYMLASAYNEMPSSTFVRSWRKLWPDVEKLAGTTCDVDENDLSDHTFLVNNLIRLPQFKDIKEKDIDEWILNDNILENEELTDDEIIQEVNSEKIPEEEHSEDDDFKKVSHSEGKKALETSMKYIEQQSHSTALDIIFIKKWRDFASKEEIKSQKQKKITDFFM